MNISNISINNYFHEDDKDTSIIYFSCIDKETDEKFVFYDDLNTGRKYIQKDGEYLPFELENLDSLERKYFYNLIDFMNGSEFKETNFPTKLLDKLANLEHLKEVAKDYDFSRGAYIFSINNDLESTIIRHPNCSNELLENLFILGGHDFHKDIMRNRAILPKNILDAAINHPNPTAREECFEGMHAIYYPEIIAKLINDENYSIRNYAKDSYSDLLIVLRDTSFGKEYDISTLENDDIEKNIETIIRDFSTLKEKGIDVRDEILDICAKEFEMNKPAFAF